MIFTEDMLKLYALPLSKTEEERCKHSIEMIRDALKDIGYTDDKKNITFLESDTLSYSIKMIKQYSPTKIHIFIQGSYANNTCVRNESDVDIAIIREDIYDKYFRDRYTNIPSNYIYGEAIKLKNEVEYILKKKFSYHVVRKNKSIKVIGNTNRKNVDTVPCIAMHSYNNSQITPYTLYIDGIIIFADDGTFVRNYPKQHIINGKKKNNDTNFYYKKMVRIIKRMRYLMIDNKYNCADNVSSFGLESLLWNIPDLYFVGDIKYGLKFRQILEYLIQNRIYFNRYMEANGIKILFSSQNEINNYIDFICKLYLFFQYDSNS